MMSNSTSGLQEFQMATTTSDPFTQISVTLMSTVLQGIQVATTSTGNFTGANATETMARQNPQNFLRLIPEYRVAAALSRYKYTILCPLSVISNTLALLVLVRGIRKISSYVFMANLALWDAVTIVSSTVLFALQAFSVNLGVAGCRIMSFLVDFCAMYSVWLVVVMSVERVLVVWFPLHFRQFCSVTKAKVTCLVLGLILAAPCVHYFFTITCIRRADGRYVCPVIPKYVVWGNRWNIIFVCVYSFIPVVLLVFVNVALIAAVVRLARERQRLSSTADVNQTFRITLMAASVALTFLFLTGPFAIYRLLYLINAVDVESVEAYAKYLLATTFVQTLAHLNHCVNFFLYFITGKKFRDELTAILCCRKKKQQQNSSRTLSESMSSTKFTEKSQI